MEFFCPSPILLCSFSAFTLTSSSYSYVLVLPFSQAIWEIQWEQKKLQTLI